jgi:hypothetical protein
MMQSSLVRSLGIVAGVALLSVPLAFASAEDDHKFLDREALTEALTVEEVAALEVAERELAEAQQILDMAESELAIATATEGVRGQELSDAEQALQDEIDGAADPSVIEGLEQDVADAVTALEQAQGNTADAQATFDMAETDRNSRAAIVLAIEGEIEKTGQLVGELSDEQVFAMNRNLNSAIASGLLPLGINSEDLEEILAGDYDKVRINAFMTAFQQRAIFERHAARFEAKDDAAFQDKADAMRDRGERQFDKFRDKADEIGARSADAEARRATREAAKEESKSAIAEERRNGARGAAKGQKSS